MRVRQGACNAEGGRRWRWCGGRCEPEKKGEGLGDAETGRDGDGETGGRAGASGALTAGRNGGYIDTGIRRISHSPPPSALRCSLSTLNAPFVPVSIVFMVVDTMAHLRSITKTWFSALQRERDGRVAQPG